MGVDAREADPRIGRPQNGGVARVERDTRVALARARRSRRLQAAASSVRTIPCVHVGEHPPVQANRASTATAPKLPRFVRKHHGRLAGATARGVLGVSLAI